MGKIDKESWERRGITIRTWDHDAELPISLETYDETVTRYLMVEDVQSLINWLTDQMAKL